MKFQNKMLILQKSIIISMIFVNFGYSDDCSYIVEKVYLNKHILTFYLDSFNSNNLQPQIDFFTYEIIPVGTNCNETLLTINYTFKIYASDIGLTSYETFYKGQAKIAINSNVEYFRNSDFRLVSGPTVANNVQVEKLISYISQSGKLPNGIYAFHFTSDNAAVTVPQPEILKIDIPITLELTVPGGLLSELIHTYTYSTVPLFIWDSDFCGQCTYGIRVCEYNQDEHTSLNNALDDWSLLPSDQSNEFHEIPSNTLSFQYPTDGHLNLEVGRYYVWQIRRSYETTLETHFDYSPIYIFEVRSLTKKELDFTDPYLSAIQSLIGNEQFNLWFSTGGELEQFVIAGESIWINDEEFHIDALYSIVSELNQGIITIDKMQIK